jgi:hypothetical protein
MAVRIPLKDTLKVKRSNAIANLAWLSAIIPATFCALTFQEFAGGLASTKWPHVNGRLTLSTVGEKVTGRSGNLKVYSPEVEYSYVVDGADYSGRRYSFTPLSSSKSSDIQMTLAEKFPTDQVKVFYSPTWPAWSVLVPS